MNKMKKLLALLLSMVMMVSMAACGSSKDGGDTTETKDFISVMEETSKIKTGTFTADMTLKMSDANNTLQSVLGTDEIVLKMEGQSDGTNASIAMKAKIGDTESDLTDIVVKDNTIYINASKMVDFAWPYIEKYATAAGGSLNGMTSAMIKGIIGADYLSLTTEDMKNLMTMSGADATQAMAQYEQMMSAENIQKYQKYSEVIMGILKGKPMETLKSVEPAVLGQDGEMYTMTVNKDNLKPLIDKMADYAKTDGVNLVNDLAAKLKEAVGEEDELYKQVTALQTDDLQSKIDSAVEELKGKDLSSVTAMDPKFTIGVKTTGDEGSRVTDMKFDMSMKSADPQMDVSMSMTENMKETKDVSVTAPDAAKVISFTDFINNMNQLSGAGTGAGTTTEEATTAAQ